ncbi:anti-sigma factor [Limnobacter litoralis]|uniref:Regulator of SigK n=1 Tax=Limnobacter litoralis TaxID=481366 RepID=A0ABQ5YMR7_9BURK|nr:anti-sigma factor [Limnobacter litoralis]GLR25422.1 DNA-directed RNA polymerase sigma-70 factor [Limnobacter litoralis]
MSESQTDLKHMDAGEYVLGVLSDSERRDFEARMAQDPALTRAVQDWTDHFATLSTRIDAPPAPGGVWRRISSSLDTEGNKSSIGSSRWLSTLWKGWAVGATVALVGVSSQLFSVHSPAARYVAILKNPQPGGNLDQGEWLVEAQANGTVALYQIGRLPLQTPPQEQGKSLQFWTKEPGAKGPTSLGLVELGKPLVLPASALPALMDQQLFEVTLEPRNGSPYDKPSGPVLLVGRAVALNQN